MPLQNSKQTEAVTARDVAPGLMAWGEFDTALAGESRDVGPGFRGWGSRIRAQGVGPEASNFLQKKTEIHNILTDKVLSPVMTTMLPTFPDKRCLQRYAKVNSCTNLSTCFLYQ